MWRGGFGVPLWRAPYGFIGIYSNPNQHKIDMKLDTDRLQAILVSEEGQEGMVSDAQRKLDTGIGPAVCFQFKSGKRSSVRCFFDNSTLRVRYDGSEEFTGDIYELVSSARVTAGAPDAQRK